MENFPFLISHFSFAIEKLRSCRLPLDPMQPETKLVINCIQLRPSI